MTTAPVVELPDPQRKGGKTLNEALYNRRSMREFGTRDLTLSELAQLLWAGQGQTSPRGFRTAPSAGALYPLELYVVKGDGIFNYDPELHAIRPVDSSDVRDGLAQAAFGQRSILNAPISIVIAGVVERTSVKYGQRAERYVALEAGAAGENILLQATSLGLGGVWIGAFDDASVVEIAKLADGAVPFGILAIGEIPAD